MWILGISAYYHDSAACLVQDGRIVAAAQDKPFAAQVTLELLANLGAQRKKAAA